MQRTVVGAEGDEVDVRGVEHDLDRHQHDDCIPSSHDAIDAHGEQEGAEYEPILYRDHSSSSFARNTPPRSATNSNNPMNSITRPYPEASLSPNSAFPTSSLVVLSSVVASGHDTCMMAPTNNNASASTMRARNNPEFIASHSP